MNIFNKIADHYDSPKQIQLADIITKEVQKELIGINTSEKIALDYGCGTGLISLPLAEKFKELQLVDPAEAMLKIVNRKIEATGLKNTHVIADYFADGSNTVVKADVIIVSLVLLHVPNTEKVLQDLYNRLNPQGTILIVDFDKNEKINHEKVHNGFSQTELKKKMTDIGFHLPISRTFYHGENLFMNQAASMFILRAGKM